MYLPKHFEQSDPAALQGLIRSHPLAALVTAGEDGITADHIPLQFHPAEGEHGTLRGQNGGCGTLRGQNGTCGTLRGHVARANPLWKNADGQAVLAIFQGPQAYISPTWYASKAATHKVVPTWNYAVVHAHGVLRAVEDADWLLALVKRLTAQHEAGRKPPWAVTDAPADYVAQMLRAIVGIEIPLTRLVGKWKASQNRDRADRNGVATGLGQDPLRDADALAELIRSPNQEAV